MYLEKLEIQGFKSFASHNKLIFSGLITDQKRGLTAVVGPNGSGKSNIADAIRWALGEQSIKTLRGKKSEDVIFSGSDKKNQLGLAEVSLFLNNSDLVEKNKNHAQENEIKDKKTKTEGADLDKMIKTCSQIVITRRVYRSGESEYLLNNARSRLSDIQMLLAKANFGQKTYSVIGQGMVDNFLNSSAAERKDFFDEATGVKQFQIKRDIALNKLESSYENLQQVEMLLSEIKPRLRSLTRQMDKLKKRDETENKLKEAQYKYYNYLLTEASTKLDTTNEKYLDLEKIKITKERDADKLNEELENIRTADNYEKINELQPLLRDLSQQKNILQKKISRLEADLESELEARGQFDLSWLNNKNAQLDSELSNLKLEVSSLQKSIPSEEESSLDLDLKEVEKEISNSKSKLAKLELFNNEKENKKSKLLKLETLLEARLEARGQVDIKKLKNQEKELKEKIKEIDNSISLLDQDTLNTDKERLQTELNSTQAEIRTLNEELKTLNEKIKQVAQSGGKEEKMTRLVNEFLKDLDSIENISDIGEARKMVKQAREKFEKEIKVILTGESDEDAKKIQTLQETMIALTEKRQKINEDIENINTKLNQLREEHNQLNDQKNRLSWEIQSIEDNLAKHDEERDYDTKKEIENLSQEIKEMKAETDVDASKERLIKLEEKKSSLLEKLQNCRLKKSTINEKINLLQEKIKETSSELDDIKEKIRKNQTEFNASDLEKEKAELSKKIDSITQEEGKISTQLDAINQAKEDEKREMYSCQKKIQALQIEITGISEKLNSLKIEAARQETKLEDLENNIRNDQLNIAEIKDYKEEEQEIDLNRLQQTINNNKNQLEQIGGIDEETEKEYISTKERYDFLLNQTEDLSQAIKSLEQVIRELDNNIKNRFDKEFKLIGEKFNEYFQVLFNGGKAKISKVMVEDLEKEEGRKKKSLEDYIANGMTKSEAEIKLAADEKIGKIKFLKKHNAVGLAGIEIQATPPGKKIQAISMLSGGERALTAIALICAIISANPSPFVVLDEVDAALDESNSERLARILDDLSNKTQFIVITHNRASMRRASILYGVTMKNDGVSQVISVKLDEINFNKKR
jgi:chromosome segregation protein